MVERIKYSIIIKFLIILLLFLTVKCSVDNNKENDKAKIDNCLCEELRVENAGSKYKKITKCFIKGILIEVKCKNDNDTIEVIRYSKGKNSWKVMEYGIYSNEIPVDKEYWFYCKVRDSAEYKTIELIRDFGVFSSGIRGFQIESVENIELITENGDTIRGYHDKVLIKNELFKGSIRVINRIHGKLNGESGEISSEIIIDSEVIQSHGDFVEQYLAIKKNCF